MIRCLMQYGTGCTQVYDTLWHILLIMVQAVYTGVYGILYDM